MARLKDLEVDDYYKTCLELEPELINEEFARMSGDFAYWNEKYAAANKAQLLAEWQEEQAEAALYLKYKETPEGKKPPTEAAVDASVKLDPLYATAHLKTLEHQAERDYLRGVLETLRTKREMLVSMGAQLRQEEKSDIRMMEKRALQRREEAGFE